MVQEAGGSNPLSHPIFSQLNQGLILWGERTEGESSVLGRLWGVFVWGVFGPPSAALGDQGAKHEKRKKIWEVVDAAPRWALSPLYVWRVGCHCYGTTLGVEISRGLMQIFVNHS